MTEWQKQRSDRTARLEAGWRYATGKVVLPESAQALLEAVIRPGDRVCLEGDNQKQADFLAEVLAGIDPSRIHDLHIVPKAPEDMRCGAFNTAPRVYRMGHPRVPEAIARRRGALDARQLRYFIAVAEELSFSRAADQLNVAQSAVSLQIKRLEEAFGTRLLNRRKRAAVSLTEAGRLFLSEAVAAIRQLERAEQVGHLAARGELGQIEVAYVTSVAMNRILPSLLREYRRSHPAVQLRLTAMETPRQLEALAEGRLDAALIRPRPGYAAGVAAPVIYREALCVALASDHPLARCPTLQRGGVGQRGFHHP
jgi:DNA-binding MarR family transcriptional regulator